MKLRYLLAPLALTACAPQYHDNNDAPPPPQIVAGNIGGVIVAYSGSTDGLRQADLAARSSCERYNRGAALVNDIPAVQGQGQSSYAYYYCQ